MEDDEIDQSLSCDSDHNFDTQTNDAMLCGELIQSKPILRPLVLDQFGDLLVERPAIMKQIMRALIQNYEILAKRLDLGNIKLTRLAKTHGRETSLLIILEQATTQQLAYMQKHLVTDVAFDSYFARGLASRINIATSVSFVSPM